MRFVLALAVSVAAIACTGPLDANDSEAAVSVGGIELVANKAISMDSEDLYISAKEVRVRYRYTNHSAKDQELTISFPLPDMRAADDEKYGYTAIPDFSQLNFVTAVNGKPVRFQIVRRAEIKGRDVTQRLMQLKWPLDWITGTGDEPVWVAKLGAEAKRAGVKESLLRKADNGNFYPTWDVTTHITRKQMFPAGKTVEVTHRYTPMIGGSVAGSLFPEVRKEYPEHLKTYCIDQDFLTVFDRKFAARAKDPDAPMAYGETWIGYVLSSGRNWRGPIKDFRLVIDKGKPENLVSFCMDGVKKISPTQFEVRRNNFEPKGDLEILIVEWPRSSE